MCPSRDSPSTCASRMLRTCRSGRRPLPILHLPLHEEGCAISNQFLAISNVNRSTENPIGLLSYTTGYTNNWTIASGREARLVHDDDCGPGCPVQPTSKLSFDVAPQRMRTDRRDCAHATLNYDLGLRSMLEVCIAFISLPLR